MYCGGSYDVFLWATVKSIDDLSEFLRLKIGKIRGVTSVNSFVELESRVVERGLDLPEELNHFQLHSSPEGGA